MKMLFTKLPLGILFFGTGLAAGATCEDLRSLNAPARTITLAQMVSPGALTLPNAPPGVFKNLPAFCRVMATLSPSSDSQIKIEVWLPSDSWNGKLLAAGNGGWGGFVDYQALVIGLQEHYATAATDTGHEGGGGSFALGHPEKLLDYAYRAVHEMAIASKVIASTFYSTAPKLSYFAGCSTGGRQGLMEAQRYPGDFDAILAGAPANNRNRQSVSRMAKMVAVASGKVEALPPVQATLLNQAVIAACDALDGVKDGLLEDPRKCGFDPTTLLCREGTTQNCLTPPQVEMAKLAYAAEKTSRGELVFPGWQPGSELYWPTPGLTQPEALVLDNFRYVAHQDPQWNWQKFDSDADLDLLLKTGASMDATSPNLREFKSRQGKLILFHGWSDTSIAPENSIHYYSSVLGEMGSKQADWFRLFMVPGMAHCGGGPGPDQFIISMLGALERWREIGSAPDRVSAAHVTSNRVDMTRPLCPYPQVAQWKGIGSVNDADNFVCKVP
jgi:feruloyl esterase